MNTQHTTGYIASRATALALSSMVTLATLGGIDRIAQCRIND